MLFGWKGKLFVNLPLAGSQMGFTCGYIYFIINNVQEFLKETFDLEVGKITLAILVFILFTLLAFVRKIQKFASTHVFGDIIIMATVLTVVAYGGASIREHGSQLDTVPFTNSITASIGYSAYVFEGIGLVLPVYEITANKAQFNMIVNAVIISCFLAFSFFGTFCAFAWGEQL